MVRVGRHFVEPSESNGLNERSFLMVDKVTTMPRGNLGDHLGRLGDSLVLQLNRALVVFFGLAESSPGI
ncbi:MAG TPA: type II toxin-antitoxin system PemK/MazF family toxin [Acidimicrobiales bacterium]|nr:type II toxin-antitoxin system PemK/MazF family toxin [Acidimicrobiales bacterium]